MYQINLNQIYLVEIYLLVIHQVLVVMYVFQIQVKYKFIYPRTNNKSTPKAHLYNNIIDPLLKRIYTNLNLKHVHYQQHLMNYQQIYFHEIIMNHLHVVIMNHLIVVIIPTNILPTNISDSNDVWSIDPMLCLANFLISPGVPLLLLIC